MKQNITNLLVKLFVPLLIMLSMPGAAYAYINCESGGPPTATFDPPLPSKWTISDKSNSQSVDGQTYTVTMRMNGCKPGAAYNAAPAAVSVVLVGSPGGTQLNTTAGQPAGVKMVVAGAYTDNNYPLPANITTGEGCSTPLVSAGRVTTGGSGNIYTAVQLCSNSNAVNLTYNTVITFTGVQFIVTNNAAPPALLDYNNFARSFFGIRYGLAYVNPHTLGTFIGTDLSAAGNKMLLPQAALPTIGGLGCTQAVTINRINLPDVYAAQLNSPNATAGQTPFTVDLQDCGLTVSYRANAQWSFTQGAAANRIANTAANPANNVEVQILDSNLNPITNNSNTTFGTISNTGVYTPNTHYARYISNGAAGAGNVNAVANYLLTYR